MVRLWVPAIDPGDAAAESGLHGIVSHVASGRSETFRDGCELLRRLVDLRAPITIDRSVGVTPEG